MTLLDLVSTVRRARAEHRAPASFAALAFAALVAGCSGGSGTPVQGILTGGTRPTATPTAAASATPTPAKSAAPTPVPSSVASGPVGACTGTVSTPIAAGGSGSLTASAASGTFTESIAAGQITTATTVSLGYQAQGSLAAPLARSARLSPFGAGVRRPLFTAGAGNTYVIALCANFGGATPTSGVSLTGTGVVPSTIAAGSSLNIAILSGGTWVDVGTAVVTATGNFASTTPTLALPGINQTGTYLVYQPAQGTNTSTVNFGFALVGDDGSAGIQNGLQFVQLEDPSGNALASPTSQFFPINASDLDGQSLTPDASRGATVDGSNNVYFFSGIPQHVVTIGGTPVDVTNYGGDGDSIASLPNGDEAVVSGDDGGPLAVISGVLSGNPAIADSVPIPGAADRDGLVISNDGTVLLSRGYSGIDVYKVTPTAPHTGTTYNGTPGTGTTSYSFALTTTLASGSTGTISTPPFEDGRDGMAISPVDASRAVIIGMSSGGTETVQLLTGLNGTTPTVNTLAPVVPHVSRRLGSRVRLREPSAHREPFVFSPPVADGNLYAVTISPDGKTAFVSSNAGILVISGVNTGTLAQVGAAYSPTLTVPGNGGSATCPLADAPTIGVLPDGKYLVALVNCNIPIGTTNTTQGTGVLVTIPILAGGALGAPVGQYNNVVVPFNDQMITH